jgi:hypothetical protein
MSNPSNPKTLSGVLLDQEVWRRKIRGQRVSDIARDLGKHYQTVYASYKRGLERARKESREDAEEWRLREIALIDTAMERLIPQVEEGSLEAMDRLVKLLKERRKYIPDLEVPKTTESTVNLNIDPVDALKRAFLGDDYDAEGDEDEGDRRGK